MEHIKVFFNGESMWVAVDHISDDRNSARGKLDNHPINAQAHNYRYGDEVICKRIINPDYNYWEPLYPVNNNVSDGEDSQLLDDDISPIGEI